MQKAETAIKEEPIDEEKQTQPQKLSELEDSQGKYILDFAKANYKNIVSNDGKHIKINGAYYTITKIVEEVEDTFNELEEKLNKANPLKTKEVREALYEFLTFATNVTTNDLRAADRGELKSVALILGMMQKGFRHIQ